MFFSRKERPPKGCLRRFNTQRRRPVSPERAPSPNPGRAARNSTPECLAYSATTSSDSRQEEKLSAHSLGKLGRVEISECCTGNDLKNYSLFLCGSICSFSHLPRGFQMASVEQRQSRA